MQGIERNCIRYKEETPRNVSIVNMIFHSTTIKFGFFMSIVGKNPIHPYKKMNTITMKKG